MNIFNKISNLIDKIEKFCLKNNRLENNTKQILIDCKIIPTQIKYMNKYMSIINIPEKYIIYKYLVILDCDNKLLEIKLFNKHPNANNENIFCLPIFMKNKYWDDNLKNMLERNMKKFNLDDSYFNPIHELKIKEKM